MLFVHKRSTCVVWMCHHHHFWQAPLRVRSAERRHQSPEWTVLSQVNYVVHIEVAGFQILLNGLHPCSTRTSQWCECVLRVNVVEFFVDVCYVNVRYRRPVGGTGECWWRSLWCRCGAESPTAGLLGWGRLTCTPVFLVLPVWYWQQNDSLWWRLCCSAWGVVFSCLLTGSEDVIIKTMAHNVRHVRLFKIWLWFGYWFVFEKNSSFCGSFRFFKKPQFLIRFLVFTIWHLVCCTQKNCQTADFEFTLLPSFVVTIFYFAYDVRNTQSTSRADCWNGPTNHWSKCFETKPRKSVKNPSKN